jgi:hypothetical protein
MTVIERTCPDCRGEGKQTGDGGGMDGGGNYHHPPCETCDDEGQVVPAHAYRGAVDLLRRLHEWANLDDDALDDEARAEKDEVLALVDRYLGGQ